MWKSRDLGLTLNCEELLTPNTLNWFWPYSGFKVLARGKLLLELRGLVPELLCGAWPNLLSQNGGK